MNVYEVELKNGRRYSVIAKSRSQARYKAWSDLRRDYDWTFQEFISDKIESVRLLHRFQVSDLYGNKENFERVKLARGIPFARIGMAVAVGGRKGVICGANASSNLDVCFEGDTFVSNCHPWSNIIYYADNGSVIENYQT